MEEMAFADLGPFVVGGIRLYSLHQVNSLADDDKEQIYRHLLLPSLLG